MAAHGDRAGPDTADVVPTANEWRRDWPLVLAASIGFSFFSILIAAAGLFFGPLADEFGWSRTLLSSGPSLATTTTAILSPFFGALIDRYGSRRIVLPGILPTIASVAAFSLIEGSEMQWIILWLVFGLVAVSIKSTAWTAAVLGVFRGARGLAPGLTLSGTAVAQAIMPPLANWLITEFGWLAAFVWLGVGWGSITFLLCLLFLFDAHDRRPAEATPADAPPALEGLTSAGALRDTALWRVA